MSNLDNWLGGIRQDVPINVLAIPGTHDAASFVGVSYMPVLTITQQLNIEDQLKAGVRVLDMRVAYYKYEENRFGQEEYEDIYMCHGAIVFYMKLSEQLKIIESWLSNHQTEFVVMIFQQQGYKSADANERKRVTAMIVKKITRVFGDDRIFSPKEGVNKWPTVGDLKGKVLVFSRLEQEVEVFFDLRAWNTKTLEEAVSTQFDVPRTNLKIAIQDRYTKVTNTDLTMHLNKGWINNVSEINAGKFILFEGLASQFNDEATLKINHLSHSLKSPTYRQPYMLGTDLNKRLKTSLENRDKRYRGFVMIDDAEKSVCESVVNSNVIFRNDSRSDEKKVSN